MKLYLDFEPCQECNTMMKDLSSPEMLLADEVTRSNESAKFLRHLTYNVITSYSIHYTKLYDQSQDIVS